VIGIDPSATGTGLAAIDLGGNLLSTARLDKVKGTGVRRLLGIQEALTEWLDSLSAEPLHFVMEGYGFNIRESQPHKLGEVGGAIKQVLYKQCPPPVCFPTTPATSQVKKYCLGSGTGQKSQMLKGAYKKWGVDLDTDDEAEAYTMARIGLGLLLGSEVKYEQDVLKALLHPAAKKGQERRPLVWAELTDEERYEYRDPAEYLRIAQQKPID
jgi:Holliday junction resolvasome RuvABC endonuclease subunit